MSSVRDPEVGPVPGGPGRPRGGSGDLLHNVPVTPARDDRRWVVWLFPVLSVALLATTVGLDVATPSSGPGVELASGFGWPYAAIGLVFGLCSGLVLWHERRQGLGW